MGKMMLALALVGLVSGFSSASEAKAHKMSRAHAKKECLSENPGMSKAEIKACVKEKRK